MCRGCWAAFHDLSFMKNACSCCECCRSRASARLGKNQSRSPGGGIIHLHWDVSGFQRLPWQWKRGMFLSHALLWGCYKSSQHWSRRCWNKSGITTDSPGIKASESESISKYDWWVQFQTAVCGLSWKRADLLSRSHPLPSLSPGFNHKRLFRGRFGISELLIKDQTASGSRECRV